MKLLGIVKVPAATPWIVDFGTRFNTFGAGDTLTVDYPDGDGSGAQVVDLSTVGSAGAFHTALAAAIDAMDFGGGPGVTVTEPGGGAVMMTGYAGVKLTFSTSALAKFSQVQYGTDPEALTTLASATDPLDLEPIPGNVNNYTTENSFALGGPYKSYLMQTDEDSGTPLFAKAFIGSGLDYLAAEVQDIQTEGMFLPTANPTQPQAIGLPDVSHPSIAFFNLMSHDIYVRVFGLYATLFG